SGRGPDGSDIPLATTPECPRLPPLSRSGGLEEGPGRPSSVRRATMQLTVRDAARLLQVGENVIYRWISEQGLPAEQVSGQYRFNRAELLEWATIRKMSVSPTLIAGNGRPAPSLHDPRRRAGIHARVPGATKEAALREATQRMPLPANLDRDFLLQVFLSREAQSSTGVGDGIALPHPRYPTVLP